MALKRRLAAVAVAALIAGLVSVPPSSALAAPGNGDWTFGGTLTAPARTTTNVTATLSGTAVVPAATLEAVACDDTVAAPPQGVLALRNSVTSAIVTLAGPGITLTSDTPTAVSATATVAPGSYELVLRYRCGPSGPIRGTITPASPITVSIASQVSSRSITRACVPTVPETPCTPTRQQVANLPIGLTVTFAGLIATTWSDGVVTEDPVTGSQSLQRTSGGTWQTVSSTCAATLEINASESYRCSSTSGGTHEAVSLSVMQPTTSLTITKPVVTPITTLVGQTAKVQAVVLMNYNDGSSWPAPTSTTYRIEWMALNGGGWTTLSGPHALDSRGNVSRSFTFPGTGRLRITAGSTSSQFVEIVTAVPSDKYVFSLTTFSGGGEPGQSITGTATVDQEWTDGVVRPATGGAEVALEFARAYTPSPLGLTWSKVATKTLATGTSSISISTVPQASGYWRLSAGTGKSEPSYISVTGSREVQVRASMSPAPGSDAFAGRTSNFNVSVSIDGYVGTKDLSVVVDFAENSLNVGKVGRTTSVSGTYAFKGPRGPGSITPSFTILDDLGLVWGKGTSAPLVVDGLVTFEPVLLQPTPTPLDGLATTFVARMQGNAYLGGVREGVWSGPSQLQMLVDDQWLGVADAGASSGPLVTFTAQAVKGGRYRVFDSSSGSYSSELTLRVLSPMGPFRVAKVSVKSPRVELGDAVTVTAQVEALYDDDEYYQAPDGKVVKVFYEDEKGSRQVLETRTQGGSIEVVLEPEWPGNVVFVAPDGSRSTATPINLVRPDSFGVEWPKDVAKGKPLGVVFFARASDGERWRKPLIALFQYQPFGSSRWTTIKKVVLDRGRRSQAQARSPKAGVYRVYSPEYGFFNDAPYGSS